MEQNQCADAALLRPYGYERKQQIVLTLPIPSGTDSSDITFPSSIR